MRTVLDFCDNWLFSGAGKTARAVTLPHTWNADDGQDGGNDYVRAVCSYIRTFDFAQLPKGERYYLEINGANSSADVTLNDVHLAHHDGGYSTFRVELTSALRAENTLKIDVDNRPNDFVYPEMADFTFYGGLYRPVSLIAVGRTHFTLDDFGAPGLFVTPTVEGQRATVFVEGRITDAAANQTVVCTLTDRDGKVMFTDSAPAKAPQFQAVLDPVRLWHGRKDPYLYTAKLELIENGAVLDTVQTRFGCRSFSIDPDRGFLLNGEEYPLRGVSRHQDRKGVGNALLYEHHVEDMDLIEEVGATTIRLAHYQHAQPFYDLCDERGMVVWAEIPYISRHMPKGRENTISQMKELVLQNYNHPSIVVWGLSNEITMGGADDPDLLENHRELNELVHTLDPTRQTTMAVVSMCDIYAPYVQIPDVVSYNHYFGWYGGEPDMNGPWLDRFHKTFPDLPIGLSEYGCEGLDWHTSSPVQGDYTEEYQAYYHEELIRQLFSRKYLWATHVWNMFDFGADARSEGGEPGQNHKGLVTFDRKYKKDAFYAYKAWLSDEPFVHLCGKRYTDRVEDEAQITVYSNQPEVELFVNGVSVGKKAAADHFFRFTVPNRGESSIVAVAGVCRDESTLRKVDVFPERYRLREKGAVLNWFDIDAPEGYFSLNDKLGDIMRVPEGGALVGALLRGMAQNREEQQFLNGEELMKMLSSFTVLRLTSLMTTIDVKFDKEQLLELNAALNRIKKP